ncbi:MAG: HAD family phosphatase [Gammaproteobacteria bacterium]|nr:MAG: HAD family phosphatase [Gammaproteobacteria bacterium]
MTKILVFDLGGVLIDWNPRYLYRKLIDDEGDINLFLSEVCNSEWNVKQDAGRALAEATAERIALFPEKKSLIEAFYDRWEEMLGGEINETVEILRELKNKGESIYALTNWSGETFPIAEERFDFLQWFDGTLVSGVEKMAKPDPAIFHLLLKRYELRAEDCLFIDDSKTNIEAAARIGFETHHFNSAAGLRQELIAANLL